MSRSSGTSGPFHPAESSPRWPRPGLGARLTALAASVFITLTIVTALADYGLPADRAATQIAAARPAGSAR